RFIVGKERHADQRRRATAGKGDGWRGSRRRVPEHPAATSASSKQLSRRGEERAGHFDAGAMEQAPRRGPESDAAAWISASRGPAARRVTDHRSREHHITVERSARYVTLGPRDGSAREVLFVLSG